MKLMNITVAIIPSNPRSAHTKNEPEQWNIVEYEVVGKPLFYYDIFLFILFY
jgi:hypothetical protein